MNSTRAISTIGSASGITSLFGTWQVCHNLCFVLIALLALFGITVVGMPFLFLSKLALPFWIIAAIFLIITVILHSKKKCMSKKLIMFNTGLVVAGIPFQQNLYFVFWTIGGIFITSAIILTFYDKKSRCHNEN